MTQPHPERPTPMDPSGEAPAAADVLDAQADLSARWLPSPEQVKAGLAVLATVPAGQRERFIAVVPLAQPGKQFGIWEFGQKVVPLPGVWVGENTAEATVYPLRRAQDAAEEVARAWLASEGLSGTVAVALIRPDESVAVFEGFGTPAASQG